MTSIITPGVETRANSYTAGDQEDSSIATLADGRFVITWTSEGQDGDSGGIYAQVFDAAGHAIGAEFQVSTTVASFQTSAVVTALTDGGYVVVWNSADQDGSGLGVYAQRFDAWGIRVGAETQINTTTAAGQSLPWITGLSDGGYVVTWMSDSQDGSSYGIYTQRYDDSGAQMGGEVRINTTTAGSQEVPVVTALAGGGYVVAWNSDNDGSSYGVYAQLFDAMGATVGGETLVNTYTSNVQYSPFIVALSDGAYVIVWQSSGQDGDASGLYSQRFDSTGHKSGVETRVNTYTASYQTDPAAVGLSDGGYVIVWSSYGQDGSGQGIYAQRYDATGAAIGSENLVTTTILNDQFFPSVSALADGGYVVTWSSQGQDGSGAGVYYKTFAATSGDLTGSQRLYGTAGNDTLDGGAGPDQMYGGGGNDTYVIDNIGDRAYELANGVDTGGIDAIKSSITWTIGAQVENLTLTGAAPIDGTGNGLANVVVGNTGVNVLNGLEGNDTLKAGDGNDVLDGGGGADKLYGGYGDDLYIVDNTGDIIVEYVGSGNNEGTDTVYAFVTYTLSTYVENLTLKGHDAIGGTGNSSNNILIGNDAANSLTGFSGNDTLDGGAGADLLYGGTGNDTYIVDNSGDRAYESTSGVSGGVDVVKSSVGFVLGSNIENLTLTGAGNINGVGNSLANSLTGNAGNNKLTGGAGNDTLAGGTGADTFIFAPGSGADTINDFTTADTVDVHAYTGGTAHPGYLTQLDATTVKIDLGGGNTITLLHTIVADVSAHMVW